MNNKYNIYGSKNAIEKLNLKEVKDKFPNMEIVNIVSFNSIESIKIGDDTIWFVGIGGC